MSATLVLKCFHHFLFLLTISGSFVVAQDSSPPGGYYTTRYDHIDVENILNQKRLVYYYSECLLDRRPCTPQGIEFKRILPEALRTNCLRCTEKQRFVTLKSIKRLMKEYPEIWAQLAEVWDPTGEYFKILEGSLNNKKTPNRSPTVGAETIVQNTFANAPENNTKINIQNRFADVDEPSSSTTTTKSANTLANKPISFSTTSTPIVKRGEESSSTVSTSTTAKQAATTSASGARKNSVPHETKRVNYNYDFALTVKPPVLYHNNGLNIVLKGVNNIIAPITDIAGKVITAGTDLAGMVLNVFGVKKT